jgi:hypothetical protein
MGIGIVYLMCLGMFIVTNVGVAFILIGLKLLRSGSEGPAAPKTAS